VIDKLDLRLPIDARLSDEVRGYVRMVENQGYGHSQHYQSVTDLRPMGIDAILHKGLRRQGTGYTGSHKLEILDAGWKSYSDWQRVIRCVTNAPMDHLGIMRLDTCADLIGTPVAWFLGKMRVKFKRTGRNIGDSKWQAISNRSIETLTAGKRPNFVRVYDKVQERLQDYRKSQRRSKGTPLTKSFEELNGFPETAIVTRVERQHKSRGVPRLLATFGDLHKAADYNPFTTLEITDAVAPDDLLLRDDLSARQYLEGIGAVTLQQKWGLQTFARWHNAKSNGNFARFKRDRPYLFATVESGKMQDRLFNEYRTSTTQQLAA
jgi:hypothetical protein